MSQKRNQQNYNRTSMYKNIEADLYGSVNQPITPRKKRNNLKMLASFLFLLTVIAAFLILFYENVQNANTNPDGAGSDNINISEKNTAKNTANKSDPTFKVVIDAGHGGFDVGAESPGNKKNEDVLNLEVTKKLGDALLKLGITPIYTRSDENAIAPTKNEDLQKRVDITNQSGADLFVSIHMNSFDNSSVSGPEVCYYDSGTAVSQSSISFAQLMQQNLNNFTGGSRTSKYRDDIMVICESNIPAILIECGYLSNQYEETKLNNSEYQSQLADVIANCIKNYLN